MVCTYSYVCMSLPQVKNPRPTHYLCLGVIDKWDIRYGSLLSVTQEARAQKSKTSTKAKAKNNNGRRPPTNRAEALQPRRRRRWLEASRDLRNHTDHPTKDDRASHRSKAFRNRAAPVDAPKLVSNVLPTAASLHRQEQPMHPKSSHIRPVYIADRRAGLSFCDHVAIVSTTMK